jgi:hypothetical protein
MWAARLLGYIQVKLNLSIIESSRINVSRHIFSGGLLGGGGAQAPNFPQGGDCTLGSACQAANIAGL